MKKIIIVKNPDEVAKIASNLLIDSVKTNSKIVLGLPTGDTPLKIYDLLGKDYKKNRTDWSNVITFNLDEYVGLDINNRQSYIYYMKHNLYDKLNLKKENTFIPLGVNNYLKYAKNYDNLIKQHGGINIQLLSLGQNGHIAYNEPNSDFETLTRLVKLSPDTIRANSRHFSKDEIMPKEAISMGVKSIMNANQIIVIAYGKNKSFAVKHMLEGKVDKKVPCTVLQNHKNVIYIIDKEAACELKEKY